MIHLYLLHIYIYILLPVYIYTIRIYVYNKIISKYVWIVKLCQELVQLSKWSLGDMFHLHNHRSFYVCKPTGDDFVQQEVPSTNKTLGARLGMPYYQRSCQEPKLEVLTI